MTKRTTRIAGESHSTIKSAKRVLEIFEFFAEQQRPATIGEISESLGYPQSSTSMLMKCLHELKYVHYDAQLRLYKPTLRLALTSSWLHEHQPGGAELTRLMTELRDQTGGCVVLGMQSDIDLLYIQVVASLLPMQFIIRIGQRCSICRTGVGKALLAQHSDEAIAATVRKVNARGDPSERVPLKALMEQISEIRQSGIAYATDAASPDAAAIAAPIPVSDPPLALGVSGPIDLITSQRKLITDLLRKTLQQICTAEGFRPSRA